jgi:hypothetical protein
MKFVKRLFMGIGGLAAAAALLAVVAPKAAHAVTATLVEVVNTRSTPVPNQDVDAPARHPYQASCYTSGTTPEGISCQMPAVPPNTELVVQNVSMALYNQAPIYPALFTTQVGPAVTGNFLLLSQQASISYVASQPLIQYSDPGTTPVCSNSMYPNPNAVLACTITGYTVSLP